MKKYDVFDLFFDGFSQAWKHQLWQGILFILFGVIIFLVPKLLVAMISMLFVLIGTVLVGSAWKMRDVKNRYQGYKSEFFEDF